MLAFLNKIGKFGHYCKDSEFQLKIGFYETENPHDLSDCAGMRERSGGNALHVCDD